MAGEGGRDVDSQLRTVSESIATWSARIAKMEKTVVELIQRYGLDTGQKLKRPNGRFWVGYLTWLRVSDGSLGLGGGCLARRR